MTAGRAGTRRLAAYGHSWVAGEAASRAELRCADLTAAALGMSLVNRGVGGSSTADLAGTLWRDGAVLADAYLLISGLNDARRYGESPEALDGYARALDTVVAAFEARAPSAVVLLVRQPPLLDYSGYPPHDHGSTDAVEQYNRRLDEVAARHGRAVVVRVVRWDPSRMLDDDAVHPNDLGHSAIAQAAVQAYRTVTMGSTRPAHD